MTINHQFTLYNYNKNYEGVQNIFKQLIKLKNYIKKTLLKKQIYTFVF